MSKLFAVTDPDGVIVQKYHEGATPAAGEIHDITDRPWLNEGDHIVQTELTRLKTATVRLLKKHAGEIINAAYPLLAGKQNNMTKRTMQILRKRIVGQALSAEEVAEEIVLLAAGDWIDSVRAAENAMTLAVLAATTTAEVQSIAITWPTATPPEWLG